MSGQSSTWLLVIVFGSTAWATVKCVNNESDDYCYVKDEKPYVYFGGRTAYENIRAEIPALPGCGVIFVWALLRHGTRYGSRQYGLTTRNITRIKNEIIENHDIRKLGHLCDADIQHLKKWTYKWNETMDYELTPQGVMDMKNLASRLRTIFPAFFNVSKNNFTFRTSSKMRCQQSAIVFANTLFNSTFTDLQGNGIQIDDDFLRILVNKTSPSKIVELISYLQSDDVRNMQTEISARLGYAKNLTYGFVKELYMHCVYENAWVPHSRPAFCAAFTKKHLEIFEFLADLEDYYSQGYGDEKNLQCACPLVQDLFEKLTAAKDCRNAVHKGAFYFAHSETLLPTFARLGLFHDDKPLKHDVNETLRAKRKWRTSFTDSFAANLIVVLYRCFGDFKVVFYVNERIVPVPGCAEDGCSARDFEEVFTNKIFRDCASGVATMSSALIPSAVLTVVGYYYVYFAITQLVSDLQQIH